MPPLSLSLVIIIATCLISLYALSRPQLIEEFKFNPYMIWHKRQWYRMVTMVFLHADLMHLIFNMLALYSFGAVVEHTFSSKDIYGPLGGVVYVVFYFAAAIAANIFNLIKHRDNYSYSAVGASGAISAVLFAFILFYPTSTGIMIFFLPTDNLPVWTIGLGFLVISTILSYVGTTRVDHMAHFWGAMFGLVFPIVLQPWLFTRFLSLIIS